MEKREEIQVSVIVPTYNHERYIEHCLNSILSQKVDFVFEVLVGDDDSQDGTRTILQRYAKQYGNIIKITLNDCNVGPTRNSYDLLMKAQGKYIAFCEGDDYWCDDNKLQIQYEFMESHPEYIACSHKVLLVDKDENIRKNQKLYWVKDKKIFTLKDFEGIFLPGHLSTIFRRNIYKSGEDYSIQYRANRNIGDRTAALIYLAQGDFYRIDKVMSCYRQVAEAGEQNVSSKMYVERQDRIKTDFEYTLRLEKYANEHISQKVDFDYHKWELLLGTVKHKAGKSVDIVLLNTIYKNIKYKRKMLFFVVKILIRKIMIGRI